MLKSYLNRSASLPLSEVSRQKTKLLDGELDRPITKETIDDWCKYLAALLREFFAMEETKDLLRSPSRLLPDFLRPDDYEIGSELGVPAMIRMETIWTGNK